MGPFPPIGAGSHVGTLVGTSYDPEVSSLMTVMAQGVARTQKTINVTSVVSG